MYTYPWWLGGAKMLCNFRHLLLVRLTVRQGLVVLAAGVDLDIWGGGGGLFFFVCPMPLSW